MCSSFRSLQQKQHISTVTFCAELLAAHRQLLCCCLIFGGLQAKMTERNFHQVWREIRLMQQIK